MEPWQPLTTLLLVNLGLLFANFVDSQQTLQPTPAPAPAPAPAPVPPVWAPHWSPRISPPIPIRKSVPSEHRAGTGSGNTGKKIGFIFAGFAVIMQIVVVGFLGFKRKQILNLE